MTYKRLILRTAILSLLTACLLPSPGFSFLGGDDHGAAGARKPIPLGGTPQATSVRSEPEPGSAPQSPDPSDNVVLPPVVLKVDGKEYSSDLFRQYVRDILNQRPLTQNEFLPYLRQMALDVAASADIIAESPALDNDRVVVHQVAKVRAKVLPRAFFTSEIEGKVKPTDNELLTLAPLFSTLYDVRIISVDKYGETGTDGLDKAYFRIDAAEKALESGVPFETVAADRRYNDALSSGSSSDKGGKLHTLSEISTSPFNAEEFDRIRGYKPGRTTPVFPTRLGYAIAQVEKVTSVEEQRRDNLARNRNNYLGQFYKREYDRRVDEIFSRSKIEWNNEVLKNLRATLDNGMPVLSFMDDEIVRVNGTVILARDLVDLSFNHGGNVFDIFLDKRVRTEVIAQEVERLGLSTPYAPILDLARRRALTRRNFDLRREGIKAGETELRDFYGKNLDRYRTEESRRLRIVETTDLKKAKDVVKQGRKGKDFEALAAKYNDNEKARESKGNAGFLVRKNLPAEFSAKVFSAPAGEVLGPFEGKQRDTGKPVYSVIKVEEVTPEGVRPFESLKREIVLDRYLAGKMEELNKEFIDGVNKRHVVEFLMKPDGGRGNEEKQG